MYRGVNGAGESWLKGPKDLLESHGLLEYWGKKIPTLCNGMSKEQWKDVVYEAVESSRCCAYS